MMRFSTWVEIDLDALAHNIAVVRSRITPDQKILLVVKADAYGHGAVEVARAAVQKGVDMLGVATLHEGIELRQAGIDSDVLILSPPMENETRDVIEYDLACSVPSLGIARALSRSCVERQKTGAVHVEVDTGMGRSGVGLDQALPFIQAVGKLPGLALQGVFTHFPASDEDPAFTCRQVRDFVSLLERLRRKGIEVPLRHAANSGAVLAGGESLAAPLNMVRPGLMIYGLSPSAGASGAERASHGHAEARGTAEEAESASLELTPVMSFKSRIAQIRELPAGHPVSYGMTYRTPRAMRVAVVPAGYGHGYSWRLSNTGQVLIHGERAPVVGRVTMDVTLVDVDDIPEAAVGDEVVLFGRQGDASISVNEVAGLVGTINYEIICGIGKRVTRVYIRSGRAIGMRTLTERRAVGRHRPFDEE